MRVPTYDDLQAAPQNLPDARQQTPNRMMQQADIGTGQQMRLGQAMEGMGNELSHEAIAQQIQDNESAAKNADTAAITSTQAMLYGMPGFSDNGFMARQGSQAVDGLEDFQDKLVESKTKILSGLQNDAQRKLASDAIEMRFQDALVSATRHASQQRVVRDMSDSKVRESAATDAAQKTFDPAIDGDDPAYHYNMDSDNPADKSAYQTYLHTVMVERQHQADIAGSTGGEAMDEFARDEFIRQGLENAYAGIAMNYIATRQPVAAQNFLNAINEKSPDAISAAAMNQLRPQLEGAMQQHVVLGTKLQLQDANPGDLNAQLQTLNGLHAGGKVDDIQFELIQGGLKSSAAFAEQQENSQMAGIIGQAQDYLVNHPGSSAADLPPVIYNAIRVRGQLAAMDAYAKRDNVTNPSVWYNVINHFGNGDALDITRMNDKDWLLMRGCLSDNDWKQWSQYRKDAINGTASGKDEPGSLNVTGFKAAFDSRLAGIGTVSNNIISGNMVSGEDKSRLGAAQQYAYEWVVADQRAAGRKFNQAETQASLDLLFATNVNFRKMLGR